MWLHAGRKGGFSFPRAWETFSCRPYWGDRCLCDYVCVGILAVMWVREKGAKVYTLPNQQSVVHCSVVSCEGRRSYCGTVWPIKWVAGSHLIDI